MASQLGVLKFLLLAYELNFRNKFNYFEPGFVIPGAADVRQQLASCGVCKA